MMRGVMDSGLRLRRPRNDHLVELGSARMTQLKIGVIGIGAFGSRVALRLLWSGYHTLAIYDVADVATRLFTNDYGGMALGSPKMMAPNCRALNTVPPTARELREVCFGWGGA